jgi:2-polyprenyl-6-methoxyphenol hydroxylase-like FAD-dependent oxidoreductase
MTSPSTPVLVCGASVSGPTVAYWLHRHGFTYDATARDVEYVFGDSVRSLRQVGDRIEATFERGPARSFGLVVGADGLHSTVRRLTFGEEARFRHYIGGYFAVFSLPNYLGLDGQMLNLTTPGRIAALYPVRQTGQARAGFLFRRGTEAA